MKYAKTVLFFAILSFSFTVVWGQITIDDTKTAADLVTILTNSSSCISVSTETVKGNTFTAGKNSYGYFNASGSSFPFSEGIVLSTGNATNSPGPFVADGIGEGGFSWLGDSDLNQILGISTLNSTVLEFDFIPQTNFISFNYIFASNEYQSYYPCNFSDGFAFLIKENIPGAVYQNLAVIPETNIPVSSQNIRPKIDDIVQNNTLYPGCPALNEAYFNGLNPASSPINYGGQTVVMKARTQLVAGGNYHIKLVIADSRNNPYINSAVFIESGSFSPKIDFGPDRLLATNNPICDGDAFLLDTELPLTYTYKWFKDGSTTPIPGETFPTYNAVDSGTYKVEADIGSGCITLGEIKIEFAPPIILNPISLGKCDDNGTGTASFDLTKTETEIKIKDSNLTKVDFYETQTGTILSNLILNLNTFVKTASTDQLVYVEVTNIYGCTRTTTVKLTTLPSNFTPGIGSTPKVNDFLGNDNSIELIPPTTGGPYEFSLDGIKYQVSNLFSGLSTGNYTVYIRNVVTCDFSIFELTILDYPLFFSPNEDGFNDTWEIENLTLFPEAIVSIFDRYGKLLTQINTLKSSWDGKYNGIKMPSDDYWFSINFGDGKIIKSHFTLKR